MAGKMVITAIGIALPKHLFYLIHKIASALLLRTWLQFQPMGIYQAPSSGQLDVLGLMEAIDKYLGNRSHDLNSKIKAIILLGTLKRSDLSNTEVLTEFFRDNLLASGICCSIIKLVDHNVPPGTYTDMGEGDEWPKIFTQILECDIIIFAMPIRWGNHSSEIQRIVERLDEVHYDLLAGKPSVLEGRLAELSSLVIQMELSTLLET